MAEIEDEDEFEDDYDGRRIEMYEIAELVATG
jgi:hypothetical protein